MTALTAETVLKGFRQAKGRRNSWEPLWKQCFDFALPQHDGALSENAPGRGRVDQLFDATAADAVDQLAASLMAELTPPWSRWFGLVGGVELEEDELSVAAESLDRTAAILQSHFDRSNLGLEIHQTYLDLVTVGTATLLFEEAAPGEPSAFRFTAVPIGQVALEEGRSGRLDSTYRNTELTREQLRVRFPNARLPDLDASRGEDARHSIIEAVVPDDSGYRYAAVLATGGEDGSMLSTGTFERSPFINFRWMKAPGEVYGRSPVMKSLPDIKTANKVVELVLKNATIAVAGIWQADDDGVLNPATVKLTPGTIIPKAVGSKGLTALEAPGRFDVSQLVLQDLRARIRHAMLADRLGQLDGPKMTATEVLERSAEISKILGATYGRLQSELLNPIIERGMAILRRRGEINDLVIDGRQIQLRYRSPLARSQQRQDAQDALLWMETVRAMGPEALSVVDAPKAARWLAQAFNVPDVLLKPAEPVGLIPATGVANG
ncbi:MAG: phage tail protein [Rhodospirillaceae bacterium]|jgi:hypothetical protein|nr:phage tail protein [Rhodospirillaceae bacterium]